MLLDYVQLQSHGGFAQILAGHDEGPTHVAVLYQTLGVRQFRFFGIAYSKSDSRIRNWNDNICLNIALCERLTNFAPHLVDQRSVQYRIRAGEVDILEHTVRRHGLF